MRAHHPGLFKSFNKTIEAHHSVPVPDVHKSAPIAAGILSRDTLLFLAWQRADKYRRVSFI